MSLGRLRIEVADQRGAIVLYVDEHLAHLDPHERLRLVADVQAILGGLGPDKACELLAVLAQETADEVAYCRACARRGVLAL